MERSGHRTLEGKWLEEPGGQFTEMKRPELEFGVGEPHLWPEVESQLTLHSTPSGLQICSHDPPRGVVQRAGHPKAQPTPAGRKSGFEPLKIGELEHVRLDVRLNVDSLGESPS